LENIEDNGALVSEENKLFKKAHFKIDSSEEISCSSCSISKEII